MPVSLILKVLLEEPLCSQTDWHVQRTAVKWQKQFWLSTDDDDDDDAPLLSMSPIAASHQFSSSL